MRLASLPTLVLVACGTLLLVACGAGQSNVDCKGGCPGNNICFVNMDTGRCCLPSGQSCVLDTDCCVGGCTGSMCACSPPGSDCVHPGACCSGTCSFQKCTCAKSGQPCNTVSDCCAQTSCTKGTCS